MKNQLKTIWLKIRGKPFLVTKSGRPLSDKDFQKLADEAERGYDIEHLK